MSEFLHFEQHFYIAVTPPADAPWRVEADGHGGVRKLDQAKTWRRLADGKLIAQARRALADEANDDAERRAFAQAQRELDDDDDEGKRPAEASSTKLSSDSQNSEPPEASKRTADGQMRVVPLPRPADIRSPEFSDDAIALKFADRHADDLRYVALWSRWLSWVAVRWRIDTTLKVFDRIRAICREVAVMAIPPHQRKELASGKTMAAVERVARSDRRLAATVEQWDVDLWLLNTPIGTMELCTATMRAHRREDCITRVTTVAPGGDCPLWMKFLDRVTNGDKDLQAYLQRVCGYCLTGSTREHALFFLWGRGANGKGTFVGTIADILGDGYHCSASIETFTATNMDRHLTELADLRGARLVTATETEEGRHWAESRIKMLTGGDRVKARFMRQDLFEFVPQLKLMISGNHKPGLRAVDEAIRRRFNLIPFTVTIPPQERDPNLREKLKGEWPGILQWMINGCREWQKQGLAPPDKVITATAEYLAAQNTFSTWLDECCEINPNYWERTLTLFASWKNYAEQTGQYVGDNKMFRERLEHYDGITHKLEPITKRAGFQGVRVKQQQQPADPYYDR